jgi:hypothetical protein
MVHKLLTAAVQAAIAKHPASTAASANNRTGVKTKTPPET